MRWSISAICLAIFVAFDARLSSLSGTSVFTELMRTAIIRLFKALHSAMPGMIRLSSSCVWTLA
jgi:hypothetical protein